MAVEPERYRFTLTEYHRMIEAGVLHEDCPVELIEGELLTMSPIGGRHASCVDRLNRVFSRRLGDDVIVRIQNPVEVGGRSEPGPDVLLLKARADFYASGHPKPEDVFLIVEVADTSLEYDRQVKIPLYARNGVPEVWLVDLTHDYVVVYREPLEDMYGVTQVFRRGETICPQAFPDLEVGVDEILG